jgi:hypothetical protein
VINTVKKYVALDLSAEANVGTGTEFDPGAANTGEKYVVSLVLPDAAQSIKGLSDYDAPLFRYFTSLKEVSGANIKTIGVNAFRNCVGLTSASFPQATSIGNSAFYNCTGLSSINFPKATSIAYQAFISCASLTSINFPQAISMGESAFFECTGLTSVSFPQVTSIGVYAFFGCTGLISASFPKVTSIGYQVFDFTGEAPLTITLGNAPPTVGVSEFFGVGVSKNVTVRVPSGAVPNYNAAWQEAFKGKGSNGTGAVNSNISLTVVGY